MTPAEFVAKWSNLKNRLNELAAAQSHFNDVCALVGHPPPYADEIDSDTFRFEKSAEKPDGNKGRADVFYHRHFVWEYKGYHGNLDRAYQQVQRYREALDNPPLLIVCDLETIRIHTNFTNYPSRRTEITLTDLATQPEKLAELKMCFAHPDDITAFFRPERTQEYITQATAQTFVKVVDDLKAFDKDETPPEKFAHFLVQLLFCLFVEDMGLLPNSLFSNLLAYQPSSIEPQYQFAGHLADLFDRMRSGGRYGYYQILNFNGTLFDDAFVPPLPSNLAKTLLHAARQDWSGIEPSIFGTLFERVIDKQKRAQLGAHYTSKEDILLVVNPVLMEPLRRDWDVVRRRADRALRKGDIDMAHRLLSDFSAEIANTTVLDPACGSGNFLYVALHQLLDMQKEVIVHAERSGLPAIPLTVTPRQLYGIEINPYAHELAQVTIWIGYIQWRIENGFTELGEPILQPLNQIERKDAILAYGAEGESAEATWPSTTVIVGNPPFLGGNKIRKELGNEYVDTLFEAYKDMPSFSDLVCYWFERGRVKLTRGETVRVGFVATNSISGGVNKRVLERIKHEGDIFFAWVDRPWMLEGAAVHISIIGFDAGNEPSRRLNGHKVTQINPDLTSFNFYISGAKKLPDMQGVSFMGPSAKGSFDIDKEEAERMLGASNPTGVQNSDVVRPVMSATDLVKAPRNKYTIDFNMMTQEQAARYQLPFAYVQSVVYPTRKNKRGALKERWWQYGRPRVEMRHALAGKTRFVVTPGVAKHRIFVWQSIDVLCNQGTVIFAREDDYFFGVLHSRVHETWSLHKGTSLEDRPRYTSTTAFETFAFPWRLGNEPSEAENEDVAEIAESARELVAFRQAWLHPPIPESGIDVAYKRRIKRRTLTNMYNALEHYRAALADGTRYNAAFKLGWKKIVNCDFTLAQAQTLHDIHTELDKAVLRAYGWSATLEDEEILENLLALNIERASAHS